MFSSIHSEITQQNPTDPQSNQLQQQGSTTYLYDNNGNRLSKTEPSGTTHYQWDARNRLQRIDYPNTSSDSFTYDSGNNLIQKSHTNSHGDTETEHYLINSQRNVIQISHSNNSTASTHIITGQGIDSHLATVQNNQTTYVHRDGLNSTTTTTDENGAITSISQYTPYGITSSTGNYPFQYTGRQPINESLYYYRARYYDPVAGRFLSEDPIGLAGGINTYGYVLNNPVNEIDPDGLWIPQLIGAVVNTGIEGYGQYQSGNLDIKRLAIAAATGALGGFGSTAFRAVGFGAAAGAINNSYQQIDDNGYSCGKDFDASQALRSAAFGGFGGALGFGTGVLGANIYRRPADIIGQDVNKNLILNYGAHGAAIGAAGGTAFGNQ